MAFTARLCSPRGTVSELRQIRLQLQTPNATWLGTLTYFKVHEKMKAIKGMYFSFDSFVVTNREYHRCLVNVVSYTKLNFVHFQEYKSHFLL